MGAVTVLLVFLLVATTAYAAHLTRYRGRTSQGEPISFATGGGRLRGLDFQIIVTCPSGRRYRITASGFPSIQTRKGKFSQRFVPRKQKGSTTVTGRVLARRVTGTVVTRTFINHRLCEGKATFALHR